MSEACSLQGAVPQRNWGRASPDGLAGWKVWGPEKMAAGTMLAGLVARSCDADP